MEGTGMSSEERAWEADKRDFVADRRDQVAAERDETADARDAMANEREELADQREAELDEREDRLRDRAKQLSVPPQHSAVEEARRAVRREDAFAARQDARSARARGQDERGEAALARESAAKRRQAITPESRLALAFAEIARYLYEADNFEDVLDRIVGTAISTMSGCDMASVTVKDDDGAYQTLAFSSYAALSADSAQYEAREGPCVDAVEQPMVHAPSLPDERWPALASRPSESGVEAIVSYRLETGETAGPVPGEALAGSLNAYAGKPGAFDDAAQEIGLILAAHASIGLRAAREREAFTQFSQQLHQALASRDVIGQAKGILMERLRITPEDAFDTLRRASQQLNVKLREVAEKLAETGEFGDQGRH